MRYLHHIGYPRKKEIAVKRGKEEKRARLLARAEKVMDEYLAWEESHSSVAIPVGLG